MITYLSIHSKKVKGLASDFELQSTVSSDIQ